MSSRFVPEGWVTDTLGNLVDISIGKTPKRSEPGYWQNGIHKWATIASLEFGKELTETAELITNSAVRETKPKKVAKGTLLFSFKLTIGKMAFAGCDLYTNEAIAGFTPKNGRIDKMFLFYALQVANLTRNAGDAAKGATLNSKTIPLIEVMFPEDINEQRRIVTRIEELTRRAEEARKLRQEAVEKVNSLFQTELERVFLPIETDDWTEYDARDVFDIVKGQVDPREEPYANMLHVAPDVIEIGTGRFIEKKIKTATELELKSGKYLFNASHVLYSKIRPNLRKVALPHFEGTCSADMYPLILNPKVVTRDFLALVLLSPPFTAYAVENSDRNAMPKVNRPTMFGYKVKLPRLAEQKEIAARIQTLQNKAEEILKLQLSADEDLRNFQSALLAKAFRGEL
jgi:type I restriction enzyme S subunit